MQINMRDYLSNITRIHKYMNSAVVTVPHFTVTVTQSITDYTALLFMCTVFDS